MVLVPTVWGAKLTRIKLSRDQNNPEGLVVPPRSKQVLMLSAPTEGDHFPLGQKLSTLDVPLQFELLHGAYEPGGARWQVLEVP